MVYMYTAAPPLPVRSHLLGEPRLDDPQQGESCQGTEAVHLYQLPDQTHAQDTLQGGDPDEVGQAQTLGGAHRGHVRAHRGHTEVTLGHGR